MGFDRLLYQANALDNEAAVLFPVFFDIQFPAVFQKFVIPALYYFQLNHPSGLFITILS
jgi:hypothetical protein